MYRTSEEKEQVLDILRTKEKKKLKVTYRLCIDYINEILRDGYIEDYDFLIKISELLIKLKLKDIVIKVR